MAVNANVMSLYIPRVFPNITEEQIRDVFENVKNWGIIENVDMPIVRNRDGEIAYRRAFVHFKSWNQTPEVQELHIKLDLEVAYQLDCDYPRNWVIFKNKVARPKNIIKTKTKAPSSSPPHTHTSAYSNPPPTLTLNATQKQLLPPLPTNEPLLPPPSRKPRLVRHETIPPQYDTISYASVVTTKRVSAPAPAPTQTQTPISSSSRPIRQTTPEDSPVEVKAKSSVITPPTIVRSISHMPPPNRDTHTHAINPIHNQAFDEVSVPFYNMKAQLDYQRKQLEVQAKQLHEQSEMIRQLHNMMMAQCVCVQVTSTPQPTPPPPPPIASMSSASPPSPSIPSPGLNLLNSDTETDTRILFKRLHAELECEDSELDEDMFTDF